MKRIRRPAIAWAAQEVVPPTTRSRIRDILVYGVGRPLLLVFWSFTFWGTLVLAALAYKMASAGPRAALAAARAQVAGSAGWGWATLALASLALLVWILVAGGVVGPRNQRARGSGAPRP